MPLLPFASPPGKSTLIIGTTPISGGTSGRVLYDNAGVVGEMTTTGSGTVLVLATSPTLVTPVIGAATGTSLIITQSIGATSTDGFVATNTTAAAAGAQQWSPRIRLTGQGWKTTATAASQAVDWILENQPVQGAANPTGNLVFSVQVNGAGYSSQVTFSSTGSISAGAGSATSPSISFGDAATGIYKIATNYITFSSNGNGRSAITDQGQWVFSNNVTLGFNGNNNDPTVAPDLILRRSAAAVLQLGSDVNGAAINQQLQACNGITGTDKTGGNFTLASGKGTGAGAVSSIIFQTPTVLGSGTTAQSLATRLTIASGLLTVADATDFAFGTTTGTKHGSVGGASGQKQAFWGSTPIVQPLLATGAAHTVDDVITTLQNLGLCRQS